MSQNRNILFCTTRQWNPGDEFILFGIRYLLDQIGLAYNPIIYNRHPGVTPQRYFRKHRWSRSEPYTNYDNSFFLDESGVIDYVIFAGTPEWFGGPRVNPLLKFILENKVRCAFLGVGVHKKQNFSDDLLQVIHENTDLITARDPLCYELIQDFPNAYYEVCPSLFSTKKPQKKEAPDKVGIVIQAGKTKNHALPPDTQSYCKDQFEQIEKKYDVTYIAHYIDDFKLAVREGKKVLYSGYSEDYEKIYSQFDLVVSTRVHGCGISSSLGIPNILIPHDGRFQTAARLKSVIAGKQENLVSLIESLDISSSSQELMDYRIKSNERFQELLKKHLSFLK